MSLYASGAAPELPTRVCSAPHGLRFFSFNHLLHKSCTLAAELLRAGASRLRLTTVMPANLLGAATGLHTSSSNNLHTAASHGNACQWYTCCGRVASETKSSSAALSRQTSSLPKLRAVEGSPSTSREATPRFERSSACSTTKSNLQLLAQLKAAFRAGC